MLQQLFVPIGLLFVQSVVNAFSPATVAGYTAAVKVNTMCVSCNTMLGNAMSAFTAQNLAVGAKDRVRSGLKWGIVLALALAAVFMVVSLACSRFLIGLFAGSEDADFDAMVVAGREFLTVTSPFYLLVGVELVFNGMHRGESKMLLFMLATGGDLVFRVALSYLLVPSLGFTGVCWAYSIGWIVGLAFALGGFFVSGRKPISYEKNRR